MKWPESTSPTDWLDDRLEAYLDGDLPADEAAAVERMLADDAAWEGELMLAGEIRRGLRAMPVPACSPQVALHVMTEARRQLRASWRHRLHHHLAALWAETWRPALAMAVLVTLVASAALLGGQAQQHRLAKATDTEVALALDDVKLALAYLSEVGRKTGDSVRQEVFASGIVFPAQDALGSIRNEQAR